MTISSLTAALADRYRIERAATHVAARLNVTATVVAARHIVAARL